MDILRTFLRFPRNFFLLFIRFYQKTLSLDHGFFKNAFPYGWCRFRPTCSQYMYEAVQKYGVFRGGLKGIWRILRCNPCSKGGFDKP